MSGKKRRTRQFSENSVALLVKPLTRYYTRYKCHQLLRLKKILKVKLTSLH